MKIYWIYILLVVTVIHQIKTLRCRSGNSKFNKSMQKAITKCKHQEANNSSSIEDSSSDENISSDSSIFDDEFFSFARKNQTNSNTPASQNPRHKNTNNDDNGKSNDYQGNSRNHYHTQNATSSKGINTRIMSNYNNKEQRNKNNHDRSNKENSNGKAKNTNSRKTDHDYHPKSCFYRCVLNELNAVNHQGFPDRIAVTNLVLKDIHVPAVRDLFEEIILECFHFLQTQMIDDECTFAQYLFECFDDKGRERCDDWNI